MTHEAGPAIRIRQLDVRRGGRNVLHGLDLEIPRGGVTGLLGPSGCGKTTLMRAVVGVQKVQGGEVEVLGEAAGVPSLRRRVAYVTQAPSVYGDITVRQNLRYFATILGTDDSSAEAVLQTVGLHGYENTLANKLSGGQRGRLSLATALLGQPELLVLDEPTVGLDPVIRRELWDTFHELAAKGATLLVSSHVMDEAERCDELILMREGEIVAHETPDALRARTHSPTIEAAFLTLVQGREPVA